MRNTPLALTRLHIKIDTTSRKLSLFDGETLVKTYPVGVGKYETPTPHGSYQINTKILRPGGVLGTRWMGLSISPHANYGIHGTNNPSSIGGYVSKGCVRMHNQDVEELFTMVSIGTTVIITGNSAYAKPVQASSQSLEGKKTYTVKAGDTLWQLSKSFGVPLQQLVKANLITDPTKLYPGQTIVIP